MFTLSEASLDGCEGNGNKNVIVPVASFVRKWEGWGKNYHGLVTKEVRKIKLNKSDQCDVVRGNSYLIQIMTIRECCLKRVRKIRYNFLDA